MVRFVTDPEDPSNVTQFRVRADEDGRVVYFEAKKQSDACWQKFAEVATVDSGYVTGFYTGGLYERLGIRRPTKENI